MMIKSAQVTKPRLCLGGTILQIQLKFVKSRTHRWTLPGGILAGPSYSLITTKIHLVKWYDYSNIALYVFWTDI